MGRNTFFELNYELCATSQSLSYFDYKGLKCKSGHNKYPIYLFISSDSLNFIFHFGEESKDEENEEDSRIVEHQHNYLFEISLGNIDEGLADVYRGDIALSEETLLNRLIKHAYIRRRKGVRKGVTFSDLKQADLIYPEDYIKCKTLKENYKRILDVMEVRKQQNIPGDIRCAAKLIQWEEYSYPLYRKVFLDFMFDFEINNTFKDIPQYSHIRKELHANPIYNALYTKLKFYYLRMQVETNKTSDFILRKLEELVDAEADWINILKNPVTEGLFHYSKWFNDIDKEVMNVYTPKEARVSQLIKDVDPQRRDGKCLKIWVWIRKISNIFRWKNKDSNGELNKNQEITDTATCSDKKISEKELQETFRNLTKKDKESTLFLHNRLLQKYDISSVLRISINLNWKPLLLIFIAIIFILIPIKYWVYYYLSIETTGFLFGLGVIVMLIIIPTIGSRSRNKPLNLNLLYPRFFIAICSAWIFIGFNADLFKTFAFIEHSSFHYSIGGIILLTIFLFMYREVRKLNTFLCARDCFSRTIPILLLGLWYSFLIGMIIFSFVGQKFINDEKILTAFYKEKLPNSGFVIVDDTEINLKDKIIMEMNIQDSVVMNTREHWSGLEQLYKNDYPIKAKLYPRIKGTLSFTYFPVLFYMLVFLALFIGVFIELLANDRRVTDPL